MEYAMRTAPFLPPLIYVVRNIGDSKMEELTQRVGLLEKTTHQIQQDVAVLTARSENFATKADICTLRTELLGEMGKSEKRTDCKFEKMALHFDDKLGKMALHFDDKLGKMALHFDDKLGKMALHFDDKLEKMELRIDDKLEKMELRIDDKLDKMELRIDDKLDKMEQRIDVKFERMDEKFEKKFVRIDEKFEKLNDRLTWSIMVPAILAVLAWFVKDLVVKI
jgi:DNA anti-recombination protein RmuC